MTKAVLLGGNGYIGRATNESWMKADPETEFYVISRSGRNKLTDKRIHNLRADVSDYEEVKSVLPEDLKTSTTLLTLSVPRKMTQRSSSRSMSCRPR